VAIWQRGPLRKNTATGLRLSIGAVAPLGACSGLSPCRCASVSLCLGIAVPFGPVTPASLPPLWPSPLILGARFLRPSRISIAAVAFAATTYAEAVDRSGISRISAPHHRKVRSSWVELLYRQKSLPLPKLHNALPEHDLLTCKSNECTSSTSVSPPARPPLPIFPPPASRTAYLSPACNRPRIDHIRPHVSSALLYLVVICSMTYHRLWSRPSWGGRPNDLVLPWCPMLLLACPAHSLGDDVSAKALDPR
jgi:hypothetical protein